MKVTKRDGTKVPFDQAKIAAAISKAASAAGESDAISAATDLADQITGKMAIDSSCQFPQIEQIQDQVELTLMDAGFHRTARAYIAYREQHQRLRNDRVAVVDSISSVNEYLDRDDWRVNANANQGYSLGGLILNVAGKVIANYWLSHAYPTEIGMAHRNADLHIHDLDVLAGYCAAGPCVPCCTKVSTVCQGRWNLRRRVTYPVLLGKW
ncbi:anaerobic ribonucleoside triphosphate reductase [Acidithiobacillus sp. GGI-221]|nr:anaerobic ribonucleoside triphosphate reductase [Acidithiobacillus sp. GGI-221]